MKKGRNDWRLLVGGARRHAVKNVPAFTVLPHGERQLWECTNCPWFRLENDDLADGSPDFLYWRPGLDGWKHFDPNHRPECLHGQQ